jgi:hypothetical protein
MSLAAKEKVRFLLLSRTLAVVLLMAVTATSYRAMAEHHSLAGLPNGITEDMLTEEHPSTVHTFIYYVVPDTTPVSFLIKDVVFRVPRNYLASLYKVASYTPLHFRIMTFYPDFAGSKMKDEGLKLTEENKIWQWKLSPNLIDILGLGHDDPKQSRQNAIVFEAERDEPNHPWKYGLLRSTQSRAGRSKNEDVYFQRPTATEPGIVIFCNRLYNTECQVHIHLTPHMELVYQYHRELLPHWQEIHQKVTSLVQSFIVKKEPES